MHIFEIAKALWESAGRNAAGVAMNFYLALSISLFLGCTVVFLWNKMVSEKEWLKVHPRADHIIRMLVVPLWVVFVPLLAGAAGLVAGTALSCAYIIEHEHLAGYAGKYAFKTLAVAIASQDERLKSFTDEQRRDYTQKLMAGRETISLDAIRTVDNHSIARLSADSLRKAFPSTGSPFVRTLVIVITDRSIAWLLNAPLQARAGFFDRLNRELLALDRGTDHDGRVSAEDIAVTISRIHLEKQIRGLIMELAAAKIAIILFPALLLLVIPPVTALIIRRITGNKIPVSTTEESGIVKPH